MSNTSGRRVHARTYIYRGNVHSVAFDDIHEVVRSHTSLSYGDVGITYFILAEDCFYLVLVDVCQWNGIRDGNSTLVLLSDSDIRRLLVQSDTEAFQLRLDKLLVSEGFQDIKNDEY